jgi:hypothetical protein
VAGLDFAPDGSLFVADTESSQVVKFAPLPAGGSLAPSPLEEVPLVTEESEDTETQEVEAEG